MCSFCIKIDFKKTDKTKIYFCKTKKTKTGVRNKNRAKMKYCNSGYERCALEKPFISDITTVLVF